MADEPNTPVPSEEDPAPNSAVVGRIEPQEVEAADEEQSSSKIPARFREILAMFGQFGPTPPPLAEKITPEHISKMLEIDRERVSNERVAEREGRWFHGAIVLMFCLFVLALVYLLLMAGNDALTEKILIGVVTLVAGLAGGYGIGRTRA